MTTQTRPTRVAIVGAGTWGLQHARVFSAHPDAQLVGIVGRTKERTQARADAYGVPAYTGVDELLERARPDLVTVCLPNEDHFAHAGSAPGAGSAEKPLVFELEQADALLAEAERHGTFFAINFNHRYARPVRMAADAIAQGTLGELVFASWRFGGEPGSSEHAHANLIETQCHGFDMLEHLCGRSRR